MNIHYLRLMFACLIITNLFAGQDPNDDNTSPVNIPAKKKKSPEEIAEEHKITIENCKGAYYVTPCGSSPIQYVPIIPTDNLTSSNGQYNHQCP